MKKITILLAALFILNCKGLYAQTLHDSHSQLSKRELSHYYSTKAKHQRVAALVLLSGGVVLGVAGLATAFSGGFNYFQSGNSSTTAKNESNGVGAVIAGSVLIAGSIPFAISSMVNNRRARLLVTNQTTYVTPSLCLKQTTIGIGISLGR